jgi:hypothetical protein
LLVLGILLVRTSWLFSVPEYEDADMGAYSIQVEQARRFALLVGNYSREHFNHPGPAFLYVQAWGESLFYDFLHFVPAAWNGEIVGLYLLNAFFAASVVVTGWRWGGVRTALVTLGAVGLYGALHPPVFSSDWMPYEYVPAYLAFLVSLSSVAAGRARDSWLAALSGWFLIHGHACFLFIVPVLTLGALAPALWRCSRRRPYPAGHPGREPRAAARIWLPAGVISGVFALPIVLELALHWPGNFAKYFAYSDSAQAGGHTAAQVTDYVLWFWWPHAGAWTVVAVLVISSLVAVRWAPRGPVRRLCAALLVVDALSTVAFACYAAVGIDEVNEYYMGYFYWSAPMILVLVTVLSLTGALAARTSRIAGQARAATAVALVLPLAACVAFAVAPLTRLTFARADPINRATGAVSDPSLPTGVARIGTLAAGRDAVLSFPHDAWPAITGILVQAERTGVRACVADPTWTFMMTSQLICTRRDIEEGLRFRVWMPGTVPRGWAVVARLRRGIVTRSTK